MKEKQEERTAHLRDYWHVVWQSKWTVISVATVVLALVAVATFMQTPIYRATASIEIQPRAKSITPNGDFSQLGVSSWSWAAEERYLNTQMEIIRSQQVAERAFRDSPALRSGPQFAEASNPAKALSNRISLKLLPDTYVLEVSIEDPDPFMAMELTNAIARAYIDENVDAAVDNSKKVLQELDDQIQPMQEAIAALEEQRADLTRKSDFVARDEQETSLAGRIAQIESEITKLQISLGERDAVSEAIESIESRGGTYESLSIVASDPIIRSIKGEALRLEREVDELSATLRESHPTRQAAEGALAEIPRKLEVETEKIIGKFKTEHTVEKRRMTDLTAQLRKIREEGLNLTTQVSNIETLDATIKEKRKLYELVTARIQEIGLNQETLVNNLRLIQEATESAAPVRPRKALNLLAGLMLGLFVGIGGAFFIDYLDNTIRSSEDIERFLDLPLLAMMPKSDDPEHSGSKEAQQTLRTSVLFASKGRTLSTIHVTSAGPGEGKSRTAVNLARTLAAAGDRVLLVDADLRRPTVHKHTRITRERGLSNYMVSAEGGDTWRQWVHPAPGFESLEILPSGPLPPKPVELFGSERFSDLVAQLKREYQWVVIDSPPVASLADSLVLGSLTEMTIFVIKHKENDRELVRRSVESLRKVETNLIGAVLNAVDLKRTAYQDYYYASYEYSREDAASSRQAKGS